MSKDRWPGDRAPEGDETAENKKKWMLVSDLIKRCPQYLQRLLGIPTQREVSDHLLKWGEEVRSSNEYFHEDKSGIPAGSER